MVEISLHILDIVYNSVKAEASLITILVDEDISNNILSVSIEDNGYGMDEEFLKQVLDPFKTTRTTRKVGLGLSLFQSAAEATGGNLVITSQKGVGTKVKATFGYDHIDRQPLGDMAMTLITLISGNNTIDFVYTHTIEGKEFSLDTREIKEILGDVDISSPEIVLWLKEYIVEGINELK